VKFATASSKQSADPAPDSTPSPAPEGGAETTKGPARLHWIGRTPPSAATWQTYARSASRWVAERFARPRVRLCVIGILLLAISALGIVDSMWTLPLMIAGAVMVVIAWIGSRLNGRFALEWGETGTQLEFRARINAPVPAVPALPAAEAAEPPATPAIWIPPRAETEEPEVIEGEAHTVEIDVSELKALIAAAEASEAKAGGPSAAEHAPVAQPGPDAA
jgi:hypothetical protein